MDEKSALVHHVQFYKPTIRAIHNIDISPDSPQLALSRSDNTIEIWNIAHKPYFQKWIAATPHNSIESLKWAGTRLFSCGLKGFVSEYDLINECAKDSTAMTGGAAWCIDFCPSNNLLACGTENGFVNLITLTDTGFEHFKLLDKQQGRIICLSWEKKTGQFLATGSIDVIRVFSVSTGHAVHKMTTGRSHARKETIVWSLCFTNDFTLISGDSRGCVTFWDGKLGAQMGDSFHSHQADVVSVVVSEDESTVYASGVDPLIVLYGRVSGTRRWAKGSVRSVHDHDVRALALTSKNGLFSGGLDGYLTFTAYPPKQLIRLPPFYKGKSAEVVRRKRWLLLRHLTHVELHLLGKAAPHQDDHKITMDIVDSVHSNVSNGNCNHTTAAAVEQWPRCLLKLHAKPNEVIVCASCIDEDDNNLEYDGVVAYSTQQQLRFYRFNLERSEVILLSGKYPACKLIEFVQHYQEKWCLAVDQKNDLLLYQVTCANDVIPVFCIQTHKVGLMSNAVTHLLTSSDGKWVACADAGNVLCVWETSNGRLHWSKGKAEKSGAKGCAVVTALAFSKDNCSIIVAYSDLTLTQNQFLEKPPLMHRLFINDSLHVPIVTNFLDHENFIIAYDDATMHVLIKSLDKESESPVHKKAKASEREDTVKSRPTICRVNPIKLYKHIIAAFWLNWDNNEMVVVAVNPLALAERLPPTLYKRPFHR